MDQTDGLDELIASLGRLSSEGLAGLHETSGANNLFAQIVATRSADPDTKPLGPRRHVTRAIVAVAALMAIGAALWIGLLVTGSQVVPSKENVGRPVAFSYQHGYRTAVITDPAASRVHLEKAFARQGFDIDVELEPAAPGLVGTVGEMTQDATAQHRPIKTLYGGGCWTDGGGPKCPIGLLIPKDFSGHASVVIGRAALPGEGYELSSNAFFPGGSLHCSGLPGMTVAQALPLLEGLGVRAIWRSDDRSIDDVHGIDSSTIEDQYVTEDSGDVSEGVAWIWVRPSPPTADPELDQGC